jgi:hypothetical protein
LVLIQEYDIQQLPAQCLTDGSFGKLNVVEVGCSNSKGLRIKMSFFPRSASVRGSVVNLLSYLADRCLEDVNLRITRFRLCKIKRLKDFQSVVPGFLS